MDQLRSIVVGIDFSAACATALKQAVRMAAWNRASLHAVHVVDTLVVLEMEEGLSPLVQGIQDALVDEAMKRWQAFVPDLPGKDKIDFSVAVNNQKAELIRRVKDRKADLLVLGTHGDWQEGGVGPLAAHCVHAAPSPVLLVRPPQTGAFGHVVACIDFSPTSRIALAAATRIVAQDGGKLSVLHVFRPPWTRFRPIAGTGDPEFQKSFIATLRTRVQAFCEPESPETEWVKPEYFIVPDSSHGAGIIKFVREAKADLVVMGTKGRSNLREAIMGSTAERIVRNAPCSILAVKPPEP